MCSSPGVQQHGMNSLPRHVGIIPDGNRRWARDHGVDRRSGHQKGAVKVLEVLSWCAEAGIEVVTMYLLSTDNLKRARREALTVFVEDILGSLAEARGFRLRPIGAVELLPTSTQAAIEAAAARTAANRGPLVNLALGYSGRDDIVKALRAALRDPALQGLRAQQIAELLIPEMINQYISTAGQPDPDLIIRTSGEQRLSGFLTWQVEQSELYFCTRQWPDFAKGDFMAALHSYSGRRRRYGQ